MARIAPIAHSAIDSSKTPRPFVIVTPLAMSSGNSNPSRPSLAVWIHRRRSACSHACRSGSFDALK
jgi:hypothetical protein